MARQNNLIERYNAEMAKADAIRKQITSQLETAEKVSAFMFELHERENLLEEFSVKLWRRILEKVTVYGDKRMVFRFIDGTEITR